MNRPALDPIADIALKDRRFRIAQTAFMGVVLIAFIATFVLFGVLLQGAQDQLKAQQEILTGQKLATEDLKRETGAQLEKQSRYIHCIAKLFAEHEAGTVTINDLETCAISEWQNPFAMGAANDGQQQSESFAPAPEQSQSPAQPGPAEPQPEEKPQELLGFPLCVPLTNICIIQ